MCLISSKEVSNIFMDCLFSSKELVDGKPTVEPKLAKGIMLNVGFNPSKIEKNKEKINNIIDNLHNNFNEGWSFLNMCCDKKENQWTSQHKVMEQLLLLGLATGKMEYCAPKKMWDILPGKMPYVIIRG